MGCEALPILLVLNNLPFSSSVALSNTLVKFAETREKHLSHLMTKPTKSHVRPAKTQISLGIHPAWSESSLSAWRNLGPLATHWVHSEDSDQTGRMPRLIWVFAGRTCHFIGFVVRGHIFQLNIWAMSRKNLSCLFVSEFYGPVNNEVMSSRPVNSGTVPGQA